MTTKNLKYQMETQNDLITRLLIKHIIHSFQKLSDKDKKHTIIKLEEELHRSIKW